MLLTFGEARNTPTHVSFFEAMRDAVHLIVHAGSTCHARAAAATPGELVDACARWAERQEPAVQVAVVLDEPTERCSFGVTELGEHVLVVAGHEAAATIITRETQSLHGRGVPVQVVTSDRDLRLELEELAMFTGSGEFLRTVLPLADAAADDARPDCPRCDIPMRRCAADTDIAVDHWRCCDFPFCTVWLRLDGSVGAEHDAEWSEEELDRREERIRTRERAKSRRRRERDDYEPSEPAGPQYWFDGPPGDSPGW